MNKYDSGRGPRDYDESLQKEKRPQRLFLLG